VKALVYQGHHKKAWERMPDPGMLRDSDAIIKIDTATICGTDTHILDGGVPMVRPGTILGHEGTGTVIEVGSATTQLKPGDRVICKCVASCGKCSFCRQGNFGMCCDPEGGWMLGGKTHGVQAEYARIAYADTSLIKIPDELTSEQVVYLSDIMVTGFEVGILRANLQPGETVVVIGAGPIGLSTMAVARLYSPARIIAVEPSESRRRLAAKYADVAVTPDNAQAAVDEATDGVGADVAIEAVGKAVTFEQCCQLVRVGGRVANIGLHSHPVTLHMEDLWIKGISITMGIPNHRTAHILLNAIIRGTIDPTMLTTHRFKMDEIIHAYEVFSKPAENDAVKVLLSADSHADHDHSAAHSRSAAHSH
jgi:alcohol dehydrogenase